MDVRRQFSQVEVQVSAVIHAPIRRVWASISRFGDIGDQNSADASNANGSVCEPLQRVLLCCASSRGGPFAVAFLTQGFLALLPFNEGALELRSGAGLLLHQTCSLQVTP